MDDRWLSVEEIAAYLGVNRDTVYKWIERKQMPAHKMGRLWKFKRAEVDDWVRLGRHPNRRSNHQPARHQRTARIDTGIVR